MYTLSHLTKSTNSTPLLVHYDAIVNHHLTNIKNLLHSYDMDYKKMLVVDYNTDSTLKLLEGMSINVHDYAVNIERLYNMMFMVSDYDMYRVYEYGSIFYQHNATFFHHLNLLRDCIDVVKNYTKDEKYNLSIINPQYYSELTFITKYNKIKKFF